MNEFEENTTEPVIKTRGKRSLWIALLIGYGIVIACIGCLQVAEQKNLHQERSLGGPALYMTYCLRCHGEHGQQKGSIPALAKTKLSLDQFAEKLQTGGKGMPTFKKALFDSDYLPLYQYVKSLSKK